MVRVLRSVAGLFAVLLAGFTVWAALYALQIPVSEELVVALAGLVGVTAITGAVIYLASRTNNIRAATDYEGQEDSTRSGGSVSDEAPVSAGIAVYLLWGFLFILAGGFVYIGWTDLAIPYLLLLLIASFIMVSTRIVNEYERLVIMRTGRLIGAKGPGLAMVIPFLDRAFSVDMRLQFQEVPLETCITKDNARIDVDFLFYWRIKDPELAVLRIKGVEESLHGLATGLLRAVIGDISLDNALAEREHINLQLREKIDEVTEQWGIEVSTVEIREILMPSDVQEIMSRQLAAERTRRVTVLEAEGYKEARILKAEGDAEALLRLHSVAQKTHQNTLNLWISDTLLRLGEGESTKLDPELLNLLVHAWVGPAGDAQEDSNARKGPEAESGPSIKVRVSR